MITFNILIKNTTFGCTENSYTPHPDQLVIVFQKVEESMKNVPILTTI